jgi:hypothetical protein
MAIHGFLFLAGWSAVIAQLPRMTESGGVDPTGGFEASNVVNERCLDSVRGKRGMLAGHNDSKRALSPENLRKVSIYASSRACCAPAMQSA